ncbi:MAG: class I SAM-dependent methyltransferase [Gammaproteobacteria bacterium]|nr:class I SAM-dependent methyltransferase [Gammaproteobacteria bacterium]
MSFYEDRLLPRLINVACSLRPISRQREKVVPLASGDVLEIGFGSGLNLPYFDRGKVRRIWGLEPSEGMRRLARKRVAESGLEVELIDLPGEQIPLPADSVDTVLLTYTLCTIQDTAAALEGARRVLKPGGRLLFCEHGKAPDDGVYRWQKRLNRGWSAVAGGCNLNRDIPAILAASGFSVIDDNRAYLPGVRSLSYHYWGAARIG